jgi:hypothetical protein
VQTAAPELGGDHGEALIGEGVGHPKNCLLSSGDCRLMAKLHRCFASLNMTSTRDQAA